MYFFCRQRCLTLDKIKNFCYNYPVIKENYNMKEYYDHETVKLLFDFKKELQKSMEYYYESYKKQMDELEKQKISNIISNLEFLISEIKWAMNSIYGKKG